MHASDLRLALRDLGRRPTFALTIVLTLAIGIGATTAAFALVKSVFFARLPVRDQDRVVVMWTFNHDVPAYPRWPVTWESRSLVANGSRSFAGVTAYTDPHPMGARYGDRTVRILRTLVAGNFFDILGTQPAAGRLLTSDDDVRGGPDVVVLSQAFWRYQLGADPHAVGRQLLLDGTPHRIVGIAPPEFTYPANSDVWVPAAREMAMEFPKGDWTADSLPWWLIGRLRPTATIASARAEFTTFVQNYAPAGPRWMVLVSHAQRAGVVEPYVDVVLGNEVRPAVAIAFASVLLVLVVACTNLAGLLLSRGVERAPELVVRTALGASPRQLIAYLLNESALLGAAGGVLGTALSAGLIPLVAHLAPSDLAMLASAHIDIGVLIFAMVITTACVTGFALLPALRAARPSPSEVLRGASRATSNRVDTMLRRALVGAQIALALVVLSGAGLLVRTVVALQDVPLGFGVDHLLYFTVSTMLPIAELQRDTAAANAKWNTFPDRLDRELHGFPGVSAVTASSGLPFSGGPPGGGGAYVVDGQAPTPESPWRQVAIEDGIDNYFHVMGIPLLRGRPLTHQDDAHAPPIAVVSQALAAQTWPGLDPLGHRFHFRNDPDANRWYTVVGVVGDTRYDEIAAPPQPRLYLSAHQSPDGMNWFVVRTRGEPSGAINALTSAVYAADPDMAIGEIHAGPDLLRQRLARPRALAILLASLATTALFLTAVGLFGLLSAYVRERRREIAVRGALGASPGQLRTLVFGQVLVIASIGLACGLPLAFGGSRLLHILVADVQPVSTAILVSVAIFLFGVVILATYGPMVAASRVDARTALAAE